MAHWLLEALILASVDSVAARQLASVWQYTVVVLIECPFGFSSLHALASISYQ